MLASFPRYCRTLAMNSVARPRPRRWTTQLFNRTHRIAYDHDMLLDPPQAIHAGVRRKSGAKLLELLYSIDHRERDGRRL